MCVLLLAAGVDHIADISRAALGAVLVRDGELNASCAVPCYDPEGSGEITEMRQYVFTGWDPTATSNLSWHCSATSVAYVGLGNGIMAGGL